MASEKTKSAAAGAEVATRPAPNPLAPYGGFQFLETLIDGVQNVSPQRQARKDIFLTDESKQLDRAALKQKLDLWIDLLSSEGDQTELLDQTEKKAAQAEELLRLNLKRALDATRKMERNYRALSLFYKNTEAEKVQNVTILNASLDQLKDLDNPLFIDRVAAEFKRNYDRLDMRSNY
ncbi:MAG: type VI secretion system contractile sheath protein TssC, partial [Cytophagaceae bacterium]